MSLKMQPTTIRLTEEDQTFLASLKMQSGSTISDKVRSLINDRRLLQEAGRDYKSALLLAGNLLGPQQDSLRMAENKLGVHSQLLRRSMAWTQELLAILLSSPELTQEGEPRKESLEQLERAVADQIQRLLDIILQTWVSRETALYREDALNPERLKPLRRLFRLLEEDNDNS